MSNARPSQRKVNKRIEAWSCMVEDWMVNDNLLSAFVKQYRSMSNIRDPWSLQRYVTAKMGSESNNNTYLKHDPSIINTCSESLRCFCTPLWYPECTIFTLNDITLEELCTWLIMFDKCAMASVNLIYLLAVEWTVAVVR